MKKLFTGSDGLDVRRVDTHLLRARHKEGYQETGLLKVLDTLAFGEHLILGGDKGAGKTINIEEWSHRKDIPFMRYGCTGESGDRQLLGGFVLKSIEETWFSLGVLPTAVDVANECGQCVLVLEEINALTDEAQKAVNSIADYRREVSMPNIGLVMQLNEAVTARRGGRVTAIEQEDDHGNVLSVVIEADEYSVPRRSLLPIISEGAEVSEGAALSRRPELWVLGTMNPGYGGTYDLNEDFRSRFLFIHVDHLDAKTEMEILLSELGSRASATEQVFVKNLQTLAKETRSGKLGYALSTRDIEQAVKTYVLFAAAKDPRPIEKALKVLEGKFPQRTQTEFQARVRSTFKSPAIDLSKVNLY
jgi:MoxR-like ATPase